MIKVSAAVIKYEDKVLLMRRDPNQKYPGFWEFPGGKVEEGERAKEALERELDEELNVKAKIGRLLTSVKVNQYEIFAYDVKYYDGLISLHVHDDMEWVTLDEALKYNLLPADKQIIMNITKTKKQKENKQEHNVIAEHLTRYISRPEFNKEENVWVVNITKTPNNVQTLKFSEQQLAMDYYIKKAREILNPFFSSSHNTLTRPGR